MKKLKDHMKMNKQKKLKQIKPVLYTIKNKGATRLLWFHKESFTSSDHENPRKNGSDSLTA